MKKRILFLIPSLGGGGAERVLVNLVNHMNLNRYDITVETMFAGGINEKLLNENIKYICKKAPIFRGVSTFYKLIPEKLLYRYFVGRIKYDLLIAFRSGVATKVICGCRDKHVSKITWVHYGEFENSAYFTPWILKKSSFKAFSSMDAIAAVAKSAADAFSAYTGISDILHVVYNTNDTKRIHALANESDVVLKKEDGCFQLVSVGRLEKQKGYERLINVVARLIREKYHIRLTIAGDGSLKETLNEQINRQNMQEMIKLVGFLENPYSLMANADLFVCSSLQEGLSTVITESLIVGTPVISTDVSGAKEVLGFNNEYGVVTENSEKGLYSGIKKLLDSSGIYENYKKKASLRGREFSIEETVKEAEELFDSVINMKIDWTDELD